MERVGLGLQSKQKYTDYLIKIGKEFAEAIRTDRRPRDDRAGGETTRMPASWEEAHQVVLEMEGIRRGNIAINNVRNSGTVGGTREEKSGGVEGLRDKGKGKGKRTPDSKGKPSYGSPQIPGERGACFTFRDTGNCKYGDDCSSR